MNCYLCQRVGVPTAAVAVCRSCGAACCYDHLEERAHAGRGPGMQPMLAPRVEILCERCLVLQSSLFASARRKMAESVSATSVHKKRPVSGLPNARQAICTVEELLGLEHPKPQEQARKGWRRFFGRKGSFWHMEQ